MPQLLDARKVRAANEVKVDLGDDTFVRCRKEDMTLLLFEGRVPMPMLAAVQKMIDLPNASPAQRVEALGAEHGRALVDLLRQHACRVSIEPLIVMQDDGDDNHLPVSFLDTPKLMLIWQATAVVPEVNPAQAASFRAGERVDDAPPAPVRQNLPRKTIRVDTPEYDFVSG
jgi:hypothetical protein